jgi:hypothetical protein
MELAREDAVAEDTREVAQQRWIVDLGEGKPSNPVRIRDPRLGQGWA